MSEPIDWTYEWQCLNDKYKQLGADNAKLLREIMVANNNEIALQADYAHAKAAEIKAKQDRMATAILLGQAEEVNKQLKTENERLRGEKPIPSAWWKDCPGMAQRTMERIIAENKRLEKQICDGANALSVAEETIANLGTATKENEKLKEIQTKWKCAGCDEIVYRHDYCARCRRQWES